MNDIGLKIKGDYHVELIDSVTGKIKQSGDFHNIATIGLAEELIYSMSNYSRRGFYLYIGKGTNIPNYNDKGCSSEQMRVQPDSINVDIISDNAVRMTSNYVYPATTEYECNNICEASLTQQLYKNGLIVYRALTHALFTNSEGQVITINKSSLDILNITVVLEIKINEMENGNFKLFKNPRAIRSIAGKDYNNNTFGLLKYIEDANYDGLLNAGNIGKNLETEWEILTANTDRTCVMKTYQYRLLNTDVTNETYYNGLCFSNYGCFQFPNESLFPTYKIENIQIGIGDGETAQFENPLSYFKLNSEVIKVGNNVLTRDTDYTINNKGNKNKKLEICQYTTPASAISGLNFDDETWKDCTYNISPMFKPTCCSKKKVTNYNTSVECYGMNTDHPAVLDYGMEQTFNFIKGFNIRLIRKNGTTYTEAATTTTLNIESSSDGVEFTSVGSVAISNNSFSLDFNNTTARYWRITPVNISDSYMIVVYSSNFNSDCGIAFGLCDPYITFTTAPSEGEVITMDVDMDIIMKNDKYAIDLSAELNLTVN